MKRKAGIFLFLLVSLTVSAQQPSISFEVPYLRFQVKNRGVLFQNNGAPAFEIPKDSGIHALLASSLWVGGMDSSGTVRLSIATYDTAASDFQAGPLDRGTVQPDDPSFWNYVWTADSGEVAEHQTLYNNQGYQAPWGIANWPGSNTRPGNYNSILAPFIDLNSNGIYEPQNGEAPFITGNKAAYIIMNDMPAQRRSSTLPMGIEVYGMIYTDPDLPNTVFVKYRIVNRAYRQYDSVFAGIFTDFMLGNPNDNFVSTDSLRNTYFSYNGELYDSNGYLDRPAVMGVKFLGFSLEKTISFGWNNDPANGWPQTPGEYHQYMAARWRDDSPLVDPSSSQTSYHFQGDPCNGPGWTEFGSSGNVQGRRSMLGTTGPVTLGHGEVISLDIAYIFTRKDPHALSNVCDYYDDADAVQSYWKDHLSHVAWTPEKASVKVYPNPARKTLYWELEDETVTNAVLVNSLGQRLNCRPENNSIPLEGLAEGIYILQLRTETGKRYSSRVVVTP